ncbi:ThiF family adenylyltransferase [Bdellovibrio sp.]|uniref:ThiF family adenylyltransferase n=1 Tax=Bdellovibrio sp. TaxID=28201 RepID=UPI0039E62831
MESRYLRQIVLPEVGEAGQKALSQAKVLVVGAGGLGGPCLQYLTAAGVGTIGIVDDDVVDITNLQRQVLFSTNDLGKAKAPIAGTTLGALNPHVKFQIFQERLTSENALEICSSFDIVVDGTDNFNTKFLLNDVSLILRKPLVYGSISRFEGQVGIFDGQNGPCYRCLHPEPPRSQIGNCAEQGVFGAVPGVVGSVQALEVLKWILFQKNGQEDVKPLIGKIWCADFKTMHFHTLSLSCRSECLCSKSERTLPASKSAEVCGVSLQKTWQDYFQSSPRPLLLDVRSAEEYEEYHLPEALWGAQDPGRLSKNREIYVYCSLGVRSLQACQDLRAHGYKAFSIKGGLASFIENEKLTII